MSNEINSETSTKINTRKLVTIRRVSKLFSIKGADFIDGARVDGWECVVKKGEFSEGDLGVYFEIDSMLPENDERYQFLGSTKVSEGGKGFRIKTRNFKGQLAQGLLLPLSSFSELDTVALIEGSDLTEILGVWKFEPVPQRIKKGGVNQTPTKERTFPYFLRKTDQARLQNHMGYFTEFEHSPFEITFKKDGSSMQIWNNENAHSVPKGCIKKGLIGKLRRKLELLYLKVRDKFIRPHTFGVCSRKVNLAEGDNNFWNTANKIGVRELLKGKNVSLQGELCGPSIQSNHEKLNDYQFFLFDIFDIEEQQYLLPQERKLWLEENDPRGLITHIPIRESSLPIFESKTSIKDLIDYVDTKNDAGVISEGCVFKHTFIRGLSFKLVNNKYLLKCEK